MNDFGRILFVHDKCLTKKKGGRFLRILITRILAVLVTQHHWERERESEHFHFLENMCRAQCGGAHCAGAHCEGAHFEGAHCAGAHRAVQISRCCAHCAH